MMMPRDPKWECTSRGCESPPCQGELRPVVYQAPGQARLVLGHARPAGAVTRAAEAGLMSPSATQQGTSQIKGHDPLSSHTSMYVR